MHSRFYFLATVCCYLWVTVSMTEVAYADDFSIADLREEGFVLILTANGEVWGVGKHCLTGTEYPNLGPAMPYESIFLFAGIKKISLGSMNGRGFVITRNDNLYGWGHNGGGALLLGADEELIKAPAFLMDGAIAVDGGSRYTMALREDGSLWAWGNFLDMAFEERQQPKQIMANVKNFVVGESYFLVISADGKLWHVDGPKVKMSPPRLILENVTACAVGRPPFRIMNYALTKDGGLYRWPGERAPARGGIRKVAENVTSVKGRNPFAYTTKDKRLWLIFKRDDDIGIGFDSCCDPAAQIADDIYFIHDNVADFYPSLFALLFKLGDGRLVGCGSSDLISPYAKADEGQDQTGFITLTLDLDSTGKEPLYVLDGKTAQIFLLPSEGGKQTPGGTPPLAVLSP